VSDLDKRATIPAVELSQLRTTLQGALRTFGHDPQLRRALIHAEGVVADRMGERRASEITGSTANRSTRRQSR